MKTIRILTIGNSFSDNAITFLEDIARGTDKVRFKVGRASLGGCSLEKHRNLARFTALFPAYGPYQATGVSDDDAKRFTLQELLAQQQWDVVTLQQVSHQSWRLDTFQPYLNELCTLVQEYAPQAEIVLHQTWAYRSDSPYLIENALTQEAMHQAITSNYRHLAREYGFQILPSGPAVHRARQTEGHRFMAPDPLFDYDNPMPLTLPCQDHSLAAGWGWDIETTPDGIPRMTLDANHLNTRGCYLAGAVWFSVLSGLDIGTSAFTPNNIDPEDLAFLRDIARATVNSEP